MKARFLELVISLAVVGSVATPRAGAAQYVLSSYDIMPPGGSVEIGGINSAGVVAGSTWSAADGTKGFSWDGALHTLWIGNAFDISDSGTVAGSSLEADGSHAVIWQAGGVMELGPGQARSVNNLGHVAGITADDRPFIYKNGQIQRLGTTTGYALGLNDNDDVVGATPFANTLHGRATLWKDGGAGETIDLGTLWPNIYGDSYATAVNNSRIVVGGTDFFREPYWKETHAFYWDGTMHDLGAGSALDVNNAGLIVGSLDNGGAFVYDYAARDMTFLPHLGFGASASAISDSGIIAGLVYLAPYSSSAKLAIWTPVPEPPGALALVGLLAGAGSRRSRRARGLRS